MTKAVIGACVIRFDGTFTLLSQVLVRALGYEPCNCVLRKIWDMINEDDLDALKEALEQVRSGALEVCMPVVHVIAKSGQFIRVRAIVSICCESSDSAMITFLPLNRKTDFEESRVSKISSPIFSMHEIMNTINTVVTICNYFSEEPSAAITSGLCASLQESSDLLVRISRQMMLEGKDENVAQHRDFFDLEKLIENTLRPFFLESDSGICYSKSIDKKIEKRIYGDQYALKQILTNLLSNAKKFTARGSINVNVRCDETFKKGKFILQKMTFAVSDTGIGMDPNRTNELFEMFSRLNPEIEGNGLGLYITKNLVKRMGGTISVQSVPGKGSTFSFTVVLPSKVAPVQKTFQYHHQQTSLAYCAV